MCSGAIFAFRDRRGGLVGILFWDGQGFSLFCKRLDSGRFVLRVARHERGTVTLKPAQLSMFVEGIDWRALLRTGQPMLAESVAKEPVATVRLSVRLKARIANFRREKFGVSSERMERVIAQLELALEEAEAAKGQITAPAEETA